MAYQYKAGNVLNIYSGLCAITETIWRKCMQKKQAVQYRKTKCRQECMRNYNYCWTWFGVLQDRQCTYKVTMRRVRVTIVAVEEQFHILIVCTVTLLILHSQCMRLLYCQLWVLVLPYFSALSRRRYAFREKKLLT